MSGLEVPTNDGSGIEKTGKTHTAVAAGCDPACKFRREVTSMAMAGEVARDEVPHHAPFPDFPDQIRPTKEGYATIKDIEERQRGLRLLESVGEKCVRACEIERTFDAYKPDGFGSEVNERLDELEGN
jgi:hypothetical protein